VEDGKLYIYKDVYDQETNTEENLRKVLEKNGVQCDELSQDDRDQALEALNAMSSRPQKQVAKGANANTPSVNSPADNQNANAKNSNESKPKTARKPINRKQKQVVLEIAPLAGKGYPAPVDLDSGTGKPAKKPIARTE